MRPMCALCAASFVQYSCLLSVLIAQNCLKCVMHAMLSCQQAC